MEPYLVEILKMLKLTVIVGGQFFLFFSLGRDFFLEKKYSPALK